MDRILPGNAKSIFTCNQIKKQVYQAGQKNPETGASKYYEWKNIKKGY